MQQVYRVGDVLPDSKGGIFLAGPTPRVGASWRYTALELLSQAPCVFIPEPLEGYTPDYMTQVRWEWAALELATTIMFWVPRDLQRLPGFTTNVEFGLWAASGKCILGAPLNAPKIKYLFAVAERFNIPTATTLQATIDLALAHEAS